MNKWKIIDTGVGLAQQNMDIDKKFLEEIEKNSQPIVHLYEWEGLCATYGYFAKPAELLNMESVKQYNLQLGKRPTGGGVIFHVCDLAFSVIVPATHPRFSLNTLDNYAFINKAVIRAIKRFTGGSLKPNLYDQEQLQQRQMEDNFCMAKPTQYDVMVDGFKVGGAAQRRTKEGFLHQGSISLAMPSKDFLKAILRVDSNIYDAMQACSYTLLDGEISTKELQHARREMRQHLLDSLYRS